MDDRRELWAALGWRLVAALPLAAVAAWLFTADGGDGGRRVLGVVCLVADAFILAPALAGLIAEPAGSLFHPRRVALPEPRRSIAEAKRAHGRYEEAIAAYEDVVAEFPGDVESWAAMVEIALLHQRDAARGAALARRALLVLRDAPSRLHLVRVHWRCTERVRQLPLPPSPSERPG